MDVINKLVNMANMADTRLNRARQKYPASEYVNEMERRIVMMTTQYPGLIVHGIHGIQLTRSKSAWRQVPEAMAMVILQEVNAVGQMWQMEDRAREILDKLGVDKSPSNMVALIEGKFNQVVNHSDIWELAYEMRTKNQTLADLFGRLRGNAKRDWEMTPEEVEEILRRELLFGDFSGAATVQTGFNQRKSDRENAARALGRALSSNSDPDYLAQKFVDFASAEYGKTVNGVYQPADASKLTSDQMRAIITKFVK